MNQAPRHIGIAVSALEPPRARVGLIIPSVNTMTEPQFARFCPPELGVHVARLRMSGKWKRPFAVLQDEIANAAAMLGDAKPGLIVFHCTGASMREGPAGDVIVRDIIREAAGLDSITTGGAVVEALTALNIRRLVLISPYVQSNNDTEVAYLRKADFDVLSDVALSLPGGDTYTKVTPAEWTEIAAAHARDDADGYFLACTNTRQIEAIEAIEQRLGKPVVSSNQAVMWASMKRLREQLGFVGRLPGVGRLMTM